jgi:hypothetical protein
MNSRTKHWGVQIASSCAFMLLCSFATSCTQKNVAGGPYTLPAYGALGSCPEKSEIPDICVWALSMDAVLIGITKDVRAIDSPSVTRTVDGGESPLIEHCDGAVNPALKIELSVEDVLLGKSVGSSMTVLVGAYQVEQYIPYPTLVDGRTEWLAGDHVTVAQGMGPGQHLLLGLHYNNENSVWSIMGEPIAEVRSGDEGTSQVYFQRVFDECGVQPPDVKTGATYDEVVGAINTCDTIANQQEAEARRLHVENAWSKFKDAFMAASCMPKIQD